MNTKLPPLSPNDHPEPQLLKWSALEMQAIQAYATAAILAARAQRGEPARWTPKEIDDAKARASVYADWFVGGKETQQSPQPAHTEAEVQGILNAWSSQAGAFEATVRRILGVQP